VAFVPVGLAHFAAIGACALLIGLTSVVVHALARGRDLVRRMQTAWAVLLTAIATEESLPYFRAGAKDAARGRAPDVLQVYIAV
jgi:hypothetical protein